MAYDRADWHYGGDYPDDLPIEHGGTHIGMFLAWAILHELEGDIHHEDSVSESALEAVRKRKITGREFLFNQCDEKFWGQDLNDEGNGFASWYYENGPYFEDYEQALAGSFPTLYHVEDTWENYDRLEPLLDRRFQQWKEGGRADKPQTHYPWWQFWRR